MPPEIIKFSDIKFRDYRKRASCQGENPMLRQKYTLNVKDKLFVDYADNIKNMISNAADNQSKLLEIINEIFTYVIDPYSGKKVIRINPKLTDELLQKCIEKARRFIIQLYIKCETDYVEGVKLFEAIVEAKILETTEKQIKNLELESKKIIDETKKLVTPVPVAAPASLPVPVKEQIDGPIVVAMPIRQQPVVAAYGTPSVSSTMPSTVSTSLPSTISPSASSITTTTY
jgi:hypothetical protein